MLGGEAAGGQRGVDEEHADHRVAVPQRRAHRRADLVQAHAHAGGEALVRLGVGGEHGDLLARHQLEDRLRDRRLGERGAAARARHAQLGLAVGGEEQDVGALGRELLEDRLHDLVEHRLELLDLEEGARDLGERLEDALARASTRPVGACFLAASRSRWKSSRNSSSGRRNVDELTATALAELAALEGEGEVADLDLVAVGERRLGDVARR